MFHLQACSFCPSVTTNLPPCVTEKQLSPTVLMDILPLTAQNNQNTFQTHNNSSQEHWEIKKIYL